ncbi:hypothetical protein CYPRO_2029 [Cyclonatronum proteinivorum]|uniref:Uncharacterized protein n=1 Tax=Cyclonatronum proteinivorum TaxID=1457365 RepID=A0A345ULC7_9BACT|nr:hypothetical protein CYPRO_2029 [Cyclonatronum proteinivorum]
MVSGRGVTTTIPEFTSLRHGKNAHRDQGKIMYQDPTKP